MDQYKQHQGFIETNDKSVSEREAAELLGVSQRTLQRYRVDRTAPKHFVLPSGHIRYVLADLLDYRAQLTRSNFMQA